MSQFVDVQRKDFWQMFVHHVVTILLLCFSWACNLHRIGALVLVIHDFADVRDAARDDQSLTTDSFCSRVSVRRFRWKAPSWRGTRAPNARRTSYSPCSR